MADIGAVTAMRHRTGVCALAAVVGLLSACVPSLPDDRPGADATHNVRLVYWDKAAQRARYKGEEVTTEPYVWRLDVPEAHLNHRYGDTEPNGRLPGPYGDEKPFVIVTGRINPDTGAVEAIDPSQTGQSLFSAWLKPATHPNTTSFEKVCTPAAFERVLEYPNYYEEDGCGPGRLGCIYGYEIEGWSMTLRISRSLPEPAYAYCDDIRDWLDEMTVSRDPIPTEGRRKGTEDWLAARDAALAEAASSAQ